MFVLPKLTQKCKIYSVQCAVCSVQCAVCSVQCALCSLRCAAYTLAPLIAWRGTAVGGPSILSTFCNWTSCQPKVPTFNWIKSNKLSQNLSAFFRGISGALLNILRFMSPTINSSAAHSSLSFPLSSKLAISLWSTLDKYSDQFLMQWYMVTLPKCRI